ncbi:MAG: GNAT family N-acetyltransferase [Burkholderiales bacterium]|nr:GNAT family N-acetyltransferase [Nitrosomonas sp.]MCP5274471.1 GNAT family N-acetyltransferase [Burkholderiales bacterium]
MKWQCRWATQQDRDALLSLFLSAFEHPMMASLWAWKYAWQDEFGVLAYNDESIIAYYGGLPRSLWLQKKTFNAIQICDVMVAPKTRGVLTKKGAFFQTANNFLKEKTGEKKPYRFAFGFPSGRHARLGEIAGLYTRVDTLLEANWPATASLKTSVLFKTEPVSDHDETVINTLWHAMQKSLPDFLLPQKDAHFFNWRYLDHPTHVYSAKIVSWKWTNKIIGIVVLRDHGPEQGVELIDVLGSPEDLALLLKAAQAHAKQINRARIFSWLTPNILSRLPKPLTQYEITGIHIATPDLENMADQLQSRCWLMGGDTDFR